MKKSNKNQIVLKLKNKHGITLISLIITIILLIILASVAIYIALDKNGIISKAKEARDKWKNAEGKEQTMLNNIDEYLKSEVNNANNSELISKDIFDFTPIIKKCNGDYIEVTIPEIEVINSNEIVGYAFLINGEVVEYTKAKEYISKFRIKYIL